MGTKAGQIAPRVLVVEDDVDPTSEGEVLWAILTRVHPGEDVILVDELTAVPLIVYLNKHEKSAMSASKAILIGLHRDEWTDVDRPIKADFANNFPPDLQQKVLDKWTTYGFPETS